jgi:hypothetical protein
MAMAAHGVAWAGDALRVHEEQRWPKGMRGGKMARRDGRTLPDLHRISYTQNLPARQ